MFVGFTIRKTPEKNEEEFRKELWKTNCADDENSGKNDTAVHRQVLRNIV